MKIILLLCFLFLCPLIPGFGALSINKIIISSRKKGDVESAEYKPFFIRFCNAFSTGTVIMFLILGLTSAGATFLSLSLSYTAKAYAASLIFFLTVFYFLIMILKLVSISKNGLQKKPVAASESKKNTLFGWLVAASIVLSVLLLVFACISKVYTGSDQMLETVNSFIGTQDLYSSNPALYKVNPLTGLAYASGHPSRLNFMFMPVFYAVLAKTFEVAPYVLLWRIIPVYYLFTGMTIFISIGDVLFKDKQKKALYYFICVFLLLCTNAGLGSLGFDIFYTGYREMTFVSLILVNWTVYICLKKKWGAALISIILEPLVVSCKFGVGVCFVITLSFFIVGLIFSRKRRAKK